MDNSVKAAVIIVSSVAKVPRTYIQIAEAGNIAKQKYGNRAAKILKQRLSVEARAGNFVAYKVAKTLVAAKTTGPVFVSPETASKVLANIVAKYNFRPIEQHDEIEPVAAPVPVSQPEPEEVITTTPTPAPALHAASTAIEKRIMSGMISIWNKLEEIDKKLERIGGMSEESGIAPPDLAAAIALVSETRRDREPLSFGADSQPRLVYNRHA